MITARKAELDAVEAILSSEDYETPRDMAKALINAVVDALADRPSHVVGIGLRTDNLYVPAGPFWSLTDAKRVAKEAEARGLKYALREVWPASQAIIETESNDRGICTCGHRKELHTRNVKGVNKWSGCAVYLRKKELCSCSGYAAS